MKVVIIGAGAYAMGLSFMFHENKEKITIYSKVEEEIRKLKETRSNEAYLKNVKIYEDISLTTDLKEAVEGSDLIVLATSSKYIENMAEELKPYYKNQSILIAAKGIEQNKLLFLDEIVKNILKTKKIAILSGPTFAIDLAKKQTVGLTVAVKNKETKLLVKKALENKYLRLRNTKDIKGVEICGAIKNVLAIASGILEGMDASNSTKAMFLTEALHDVRFLIKSLNGKKNTILSYAGFGDIILTCSSNNSRNFQLGVLIGKGKTKKEIEEYRNANTVEGIYTLQALTKLLKREQVELPILHLIYNIIFKETPKEALLQFLIKKD